MFRELEFQSKVFNTLEAYLDALSTSKTNADEVEKVRAENPAIPIPTLNFTEDAWKIMQDDGRLPVSRQNIPFSQRQDGIGRPVPNVTLKVPTGGGKTWLAVKSASMTLNKYLGQNTGFILWIVPSEAIYTQTLKHFKNRDHPYRQAFDRAAAGRVKIMTKNDRLNAVDIDTHLCVMVLMLQSGNRQNKETLRMFRDRGDVHGFVPPEGEQQSHIDMVRRIPNLDHYGGGLSTLVKSSLGNALRIIRPVVVMDEGHKAISDLAYQTLYGFNPSFVLELTATPKDVQPRGGRNPVAARFANLLVETTGKELDREGMIKMPLILDPHVTSDWETVLDAAVGRLNILQGKAAAFQAESNRYIRPILLVQVERTGRDTRDGDHIHAEDVREYLLNTGFDLSEIAIKTAEQNDLNIPENQDLLSPYNRVRVIITKQALQEGWDCPFAYVLCSLAARTNINAMTQLVGRVLRQPNAEKTGVEALDQCYVFTHMAVTNAVIAKIKRGLEKDGLGDLVVSVNTEDSRGTATNPRNIRRREQFRSAQIFLPRVLINRDGVMMPLDFETDILTRINWHQFDHKEVIKAVHFDPFKANRQLIEITVNDHHAKNRLEELTAFNPVQVVRQINDIILNPFVAWSLVDRLVDDLKDQNYDDKALGYRSARLVQSLREELFKEQNRQAETLFKKAVHDGLIQFRLRADDMNWSMPKTIRTQEADQAGQISNEIGNPIQKSLFERVYLTELNKAESEVAIYLDKQEALSWWYRNVARRDYGLKGWKKNVIYPDFIFSVEKDGRTKQLVALETKGVFLDGTKDTEYKRALMKLLTENFDWDKTVKAGELEFEQNGARVSCDLVLLDEWQTVLPEKYFN